MIHRRPNAGLLLCTKLPTSQMLLGTGLVRLYYVKVWATQRNPHYITLKCKIGLDVTTHVILLHISLKLFIIQVLVIEFVTLAIEFVALAQEFIIIKLSSKRPLITK